MLSKQPLQDLDDPIGWERPSTGDGEPLSGVLVQDRQALQPPSIGGLGIDKVIAPDMIGIRRTGWRGRALAHWAPFTRFLDDLQPLVLPEAAYRLVLPPTVQPFTSGQSSDSQNADNAPRAYGDAASPRSGPAGLTADHRPSSRYAITLTYQLDAL